MLCRVRQTCLSVSCIAAVGALLGGPTLSAAHVKSWARTAPPVHENQSHHGKAIPNSKKSNTPSDAGIVAFGCAKLIDTDANELLTGPSLITAIDAAPRALCGIAVLESRSFTPVLHQPSYRALAPPL